MHFPTLEKIQSANERHFSETFRASLVRFSIKEQTLFAKRLSFLIKAGVPLVEGLSLMRAQARSKNEGLMFDAIISDVSSGQYLSTSLARFRAQFGDFTVNLIRIGEHSGILSENLIYLADELAKKHALKRKVRAALVYPLFIGTVTLGVTGMLTVFIFPKIMPIFVSLDMELPLSTRVLLAISTFLSSYWLHLAVSLIAATVSFFYLRSGFPTIRHITDRALLSLPIVGEIARSYNTANFCRTLGVLLRSGIHITEALRITADVTENRAYRTIISNVATEVENGGTIARQLSAHHNLFPYLTTHLIAIGEATSELRETLRYLSELYEDEVEEKTKNLSSSIEPILLVAMGLIVGLIAISVITPIYDITRHLRR